MKHLSVMPVLLLFFFTIFTSSTFAFAENSSDVITSTSSPLADNTVEFDEQNDGDVNDDANSYPRTEIHQAVKSHWIDGKLVFEKIPITVTIDKIENLNFKTTKTQSGGWVKTDLPEYPRISPMLYDQVNSGIDRLDVTIYLVNDEKKQNQNIIQQLTDEEKRNLREQISSENKIKQQDLVDFLLTNDAKIWTQLLMYNTISANISSSLLEDLEIRSDILRVSGFELEDALHVGSSRQATGSETSYISKFLSNPVLNIKILNYASNSNFKFSITPQDSATFIKFDIPNDSPYDNNVINNSESTDLTISVNDIILQNTQYLLDNTNQDVITFQINLSSVTILDKQNESQMINNKNVDYDIKNKNVDYDIKNKYLKSIFTLKQQLHQGVSLEKIQCKENYILMLKPTINSPVCVTELTSEKLVNRGWVLFK